MGHPIAVILHAVALTSFAIASGYACKFLLMAGFWTGTLIGVTIYAIALCCCSNEYD